MEWTKLKSAVVGAAMSLTAGAVAAVAQPAITNESNTKTSSTPLSLSPEVRQQLEKQKAAMRAVYLEFTETIRGTLTNWDYAVAPAFSAYFEGSQFYRHELDGPGYEYYETEVAFDGQN